MFSDCFLYIQCSTCKVDAIIPILQMGKPSLKICEKIAWGHIASKGLVPRQSDPRAHINHYAVQNLVLTWLCQCFLGDLRQGPLPPWNCLPVYTSI